MILSVPMHRTALVLLLLASAPFAARAAEVADSPGTLKQTLMLVVLTLAHGDAALGKLVQSALVETGQVKLVRKAQSAQLIAKLAVARGHGDLDLDLGVFRRDGTPLVLIHERVPPSRRPSDGARSIARQVAAAIRGEPPGAQSPTAAPDESSSSPPRERSATPARKDAASPFVAEVPLADAPSASAEPPAPRESRRASRERPFAAAASENSGPRSHFGPDPETNHLDFIIGINFAGGPWAADPARLASGSSSGFDLTHYAPSFTRTLDGHWHGGLDLHAGVRFLGYCSFEAAFQNALWGGNNGVALKGVRIAGYPLAAVLPLDRLDLGLEFGAGHAFVASGPYDMSGPYVTLGFTGEYALTRSIGVTVYYRLAVSLLTHFYVDYNNDLGEPTSVFANYWNTFGVGINLHPSVSW